MEPIRCYNCGSPISAKWDLFKLLCRHLSNKKDVMMIFNLLNIDRYCCRKIFTSTQIFRDLELRKFI